MTVCVIVEFGKVGIGHRERLEIDLFIIIRSWQWLGSHVVYCVCEFGKTKLCKAE